jgi:uncharacterized protein YhaN
LVGGCLAGIDGRELCFLRRKKRKADLLDPDGKPLDPGLLAAFLHGIEPALFESLYGIDHKTLVQGGEDILAQKGEVGQALFAAGAGISSLKKIMDALDAEADELFKARGAKQKISLAVKEYKDLKKIVKDASLSSRKWKEQKGRLQAAEQEQAGLEDDSRRKSAEVRRLVRLNRAIPELAELETLKKQLRELGEAVLLPPEFPERLRQVEQETREVKLQLDKDADRLETLQARREGISPNIALLDHGETIEDLHQRLGEYRKGRQDRIRLDGMRINNRRDAAALIKEIRPELKLEDAESLRPVLGKKRTIQTLSSGYEALTQQALQVQKHKDEAEKELSEIAEALSGLPAARPSDGLAKALKLARRAGDIDGQIAEIAREIDAGKKNCRAELKRLGLWRGELGQLLEVSLPLPETVRRFEAEFSQLDHQRQQLDKDRKTAEAELTAARTDQKEVTYGGEVPTESDLENSRQKRQAGWQLLRRQWIDGEDVSKAAEEYEPGLTLHGAYEKNVEQADYIADRLRREAGRVTKAASLRARIESLDGSIREITRQQQEFVQRGEDLASDWQAKWEPIRIVPLSPKEMAAWLSAIDTLRFKVSETFGRQGEAAAKDKVRQNHRKALAAELKALGESEVFPGRELSPVVVFAESVLEDIGRHGAELEKLADRQAQVLTALEKARKEQEAAAAARTEWRQRWNKALAGLGLADQVLPGEALDLLETVGDCLGKLEKAREFQSRIDGIGRDIDQFCGDVRALVEQAAPDLVDLSPDQASLQLHTMLGKARQDSELLKKNNEEVEVVAAEIENTQKVLQSLDGQMAELLATAGCHTAADLAEAVRKSDDYRRLREKISAAESSLAKVSEGVPLEEIKRQAGEVEVDQLPGQIVSLRRQVDEELYPKIKNISKVIGEENRELKLMDGSAQAAEAAEKMEQVAARIRRFVGQYARIKLAARVLKDEIERYREENQEPVLQIASRLFSELTLGSFAGLRTDVDDNGRPILVGLRSNDNRVTVEGLSDGTCDQLYLALRLATLQWRLETVEPMPFIVDDILINFDDARTRATLKVLADLSNKNQVILFTHHSRIVDEAKRIKGDKPVQVLLLN